MQRLENDLFGPHDCSHAPPDNYPITPTDGKMEPSGLQTDGASLLDKSPQVLLTSLSLGTVPLEKKPSLFAEGKEESSVDARCLLATAVITLFSVSNKEVLHGGQASSYVLLSHGLPAWTLHWCLRTVPEVKLERCGQGALQAGEAVS